MPLRFIDFRFIQRTVLAAHDDRDRQKRHTKAAAKAAEAFNLGLGVMPEGMEVDEDPAMVLALRAERKDCRAEQPKDQISRNQWHDRALKVSSCSSWASKRLI